MIPGALVRGSLLGVILSLALPGGAQAQRELTLENFAATIEVESTGWIDVMEELRFRFDGEWNGIFRRIPFQYDLGGGESRRIKLDIVDVRGGDGEELEYEVSTHGAYRQVKVWIPGANDVTRTVVLRYRARDALGFFESHDELYWNVTGNEWEIPIRAASARIVLPDGAAQLQAAAYTGAYGERGEDARVTQIEEGFFFETTRPLAYKEGLTAVVGWSPGLVHRPGPVEKAFRAGAFLLLLPLVSFVGMWRLWVARGRDPKRRAIQPRYEPPEGMRPAEVGTLVDHSPDIRDLTAGLVDLAVRGYLRIEENEKKGIARIFGKDDFTFHRLKEPGPELRGHERKLLEAVFGFGTTTVTTDDLEKKFYKEIPDLKDAIFAQLMTEGLYHRRPDQVLALYVGLGVTITVIGAILGSVVAGLAGYNPLIGSGAAAGIGLPIALFGAFMPARTVRGAQRLEEILGFEEFMEKVDSDRFRRMIKSPEQFEAFLPFAMALKVEDRWAKAFEDIYREPPEWYVGHNPGAFRPSTFVSSLDSMASRAGSAMTSAPRSSSGSGFSSGGGGGGGFSGGGSGGGGGGGF